MEVREFDYLDYLGYLSLCGGCHHAYDGFLISDGHCRGNKADDN